MPMTAIIKSILLVLTFAFFTTNQASAAAFIVSLSPQQKQANVMQRTSSVSIGGHRQQHTMQSLGLHPIHHNGGDLFHQHDKNLLHSLQGFASSTGSNLAYKIRAIIPTRLMLIFFNVMAAFEYASDNMFPKAPPHRKDDDDDDDTFEDEKADDSPAAQDDAGVVVVAKQNV